MKRLIILIASAALLAACSSQRTPSAAPVSQPEWQAKAYATPHAAPTPSAHQIARQEQHMAAVNVDCGQVVDELNKGMSVPAIEHDLGVTKADVKMCRAHAQKTYSYANHHPKYAVKHKVDCDKVVWDVDHGMDMHGAAVHEGISVHSVAQCLVVAPADSSKNL